MHHFAYRDGVLHAEDVDLRVRSRAGRNAVLLLFARHDGAPLSGLQRRIRGAPDSRLLCHEGQFQPGGAAAVRPSRRRHGRGLGRRAAAGAGGRHPMPARSPSRAWARRSARSPSRSTRTSSASTSNPRRSLRCCPASPHHEDAPRGSRCASIRTSTPAPMPRSRPARLRTSSAFRSVEHATSTARRRHCRG